MKGGGWLERERERAKEKERKGERMSPIFIAWLQNENDTLWWWTQEGQIRHWRMGWNEMSAITCVACVLLLVCACTPVSLWYMYGHGQSPPCTLCLPLLCLPISASLSLSLSHTLQTIPPSGVREFGGSHWFEGCDIWDSSVAGRAICGFFLRKQLPWPSWEELPHWSSPKTSMLTWYLSGVKSHGGMLGFVWRPHLVTDVQKAPAESGVG